MIITIFLIWLAITTSINTYLYLLEREVMDHLIHEVGYARSEIQEIRGTKGKLPLFAAWVIFEDEPHVQYMYLKRGDEIFQLSYSLSEAGRRNGMNHHGLRYEELVHYIPKFGDNNYIKRPD